MAQRTDTSSTVAGPPPPRSLDDLRQSLASVLLRVNQLDLELAADVARSRDLQTPVGKARTLEIERLHLRARALTYEIKVRKEGQRPVPANTVGRK